MTTTQSRPRVTTDDLEAAIGWLLALEGEAGTPVAGQQPEDDDDDQAAMRRVASWLRGEVQRRHDDATVRSLVAANPGATPAMARAALRSTRRG